MLEVSFSKVYSKFKLHFYHKVFERWQDREASLTTVETFCMEIIYELNKPTINQFAVVANLSSPNAAYKVTSLIKKGYVRKVQSETDKREFRLEVTDKYLNYYNISYEYMNVVMKRMRERFSEQELEVMEEMLKVMYDELMPEIQINEA